MTHAPEFSFAELPQCSKGIYHLAIEAEETPDLLERIFLASGDTTSRQNIRGEIRKYFSAGKLSIPVLAARGAANGEALIATAGVHGDEYEGMEAIYQIFEILEPSRMNGTFVAIPSVTPPAYWLGSRLNPLDSQNMARLFPGSLDGSISERLAGLVLDRVLRHASLYIDLHSSGRNNHMMTLCGYVTSGGQSELAGRGAECFGAPVIWKHPNCSPGRTISATLELGIPSLYAESYGGGHLRNEDVQCYVRGLANLLSLLKITRLPQSGLPPDYHPLRLSGSGDLDMAVESNQSGFFLPSVELGAGVRAGERLGTLRGPDGRIIDEILSPKDGIILLIRATPRIFKGEIVAAVAEQSLLSDGTV